MALALPTPGSVMMSVASVTSENHGRTDSVCLGTIELPLPFAGCLSSNTDGVFLLGVMGPVLWNVEP